MDATAVLAAACRQLAGVSDWPHRCRSEVGTACCNQPSRAVLCMPIAALYWVDSTKECIWVNHTSSAEATTVPKRAAPAMHQATSCSWQRTAPWRRPSRAPSRRGREALMSSSCTPTPTPRRCRASWPPSSPAPRRSCRCPRSAEMMTVISYVHVCMYIPWCLLMLHQYLTAPLTAACQDCLPALLGRAHCLLVDLPTSCCTL